MLCADNCILKEHFHTCLVRAENSSSLLKLGASGPLVLDEMVATTRQAIGFCTGTLFA